MLDFGFDLIVGFVGGLAYCLACCWSVVFSCRFCVFVFCCLQFGFCGFVGCRLGVCFAGLEFGVVLLLILWALCLYCVLCLFLVSPGCGLGLRTCSRVQLVLD